ILIVRDEHLLDIAGNLRRHRHRFSTQIGVVGALDILSAYLIVHDPGWQHDRYRACQRDQDATGALLPASGNGRRILLVSHDDLSPLRDSEMCYCVQMSGGATPLYMAPWYFYDHRYRCRGPAARILSEGPADDGPADEERRGFLRPNETAEVHRAD